MKEIDLFSQMGQSKNKEIVGGGSIETKLQVFDYQGKSLDYGLLNGEPIFNLNAVAELIGIANPRTSIDTGDNDYCIKVENSVVGLTYNRILNNRGELFLTEAGLYNLLMRSDKAEAKGFQKWVTKEVLPSIRKTGSYSVAPKLPQTYAEALRELADKVERVAELENKIQVDKPKVEYATDILSAVNSQSIGDFAKFLAGKGIKTGQNRFFAWLRANHYLKSDNTPYQRYVDCGYFILLPQAYKNGDKRTLTHKTLITAKGAYFFSQIFIRKVKNIDKLMVDTDKIVDFDR